ncbi:MAG: ATP-dependent DNA helicase RecG [Calditrichaeota bacterium]|nr:ATP-dependent DNA helicase RecG [Calditrichota bacterium]RQW03087.1 MAG: ATP-dependent DNA helicase RecG [Calditrichota bacterium]
MGDTFRSTAETDVQYVKGVGEARAALLHKAGIETVEDLLTYIPRRYLDRSTIMKISQVSEGEDVTVVGRIVKIKKIPRPHQRLIITIYDKTGILDGVWFNQVDYFQKVFKEDQEVAFSGKIGFYRGWQIVHPDFDIIEESKEQLHTGQIIPLYPSGQELRSRGLSSRGFRRIIYNALDKYGDAVSENLPEMLLNLYRLRERPEAIRKIHFPEKMSDIHESLRRLKYEELFYLEILMALRHFQHRSPVKGITMKTSGETIRKVLNKVTYELTGAQRRVLREIYDDLRSGHPMNRLLQGDVGSGKTVVALISALIAIENSYQVALMAPTEILAEQHYLNIRELLSGTGIEPRILTGSLKSQTKKELHSALKEGDLSLVIGTHALVQEAVEFRKLGLVIIDEQHRFGVLQRGELIAKGWNPHVLVMTATPIPRTMAMTLYGDLDTSVIDEMPPGRKTVITAWRTEKKLPEVYKFIREKIKAGEQAYIVYPLVEESEKMDLKAATESFEFLRNHIFKDFNLALLHGRMKSSDKETAMQQFKKGEIQILVSTSVIEVGVDVPQSTIMLIEHAERFGLSQLHQLRGRVGRGSKKSYCILITPEDINETARQRMKMIEKTTDGFVIAEEDLRLRGSGEFFGTRQHGLPDLKYSDLVEDRKIIETARQDAFAIIEKDPQLRLPENQKIRDYFKIKYQEKYQLIQIS